jgi:hypothetical protein
MRAQWSAPISNQQSNSSLPRFHTRLCEAARIAKAAEAYVQNGAIAEGVRVSMDIEQLIYEAGRLHDAASLLGRMGRDSI